MSFNLQPKVSILITSYNQAGYIRTCLDSILDQDYANLELIIIDDASTDETQSVLSDYALKYPSLIKQKFHKQRFGVATCKNHALKMCSGKYICFLSGCEVLHLDKIKRQVQYMEDNPGAVLCYHNAEVFFPKEAQHSTHLYNKHPSSHGALQDSLYQIPFFICPVSALIRRESFPDHGFNARFAALSDQLLLVQVASKGTIQYMDDVLIRYPELENRRELSVQAEEHSALLCLVEQYYPQYWRACIKGYAFLYHQYAKDLLDKKSYRYALIYAIRSLIRGSFLQENRDLIVEILKKRFRG